MGLVGTLAYIRSPARNPVLIASGAVTPGPTPTPTYTIANDADIAAINAIPSLPTGAIIDVLYNIYRQQLSRSENLLVVRGPLTGPKPLFDCSEAVTAWSATSGRTNVQQATVTLVGGSKSLGNAWLGDAVVPQVASLDACEATPGTLYVSDWTSSAPQTIYFSAAAAPANFTISVRHHGLRLTGAGVTIQRIRGRRNAHQDGSIVTPGENALWEDVAIEDGCRHAGLSGAGALLRRIRGYRAWNYLEAGQSANSFVCNQINVLGKSYATEDCIWDGGDSPNFSPLSNHGGNAADRWASITHTRDQFINCKQCGDGHAVNQVFDACTFTNCTQGPFIGTSGIGLTIKNCSGSLDQVFKNDTATGITVTCQNNSWTPNTIGTGLYRADSSGPSTGNTYNFVNETVYSIGATSGTGDLIRIADGTVNVSGINVGPNLFGLKLLHLMRLGFNGGTVTLSANNNHYPFGRDFIINGTTYATFDAYRTATGQDAGSDLNGTGGVGGATALFFSDNFNRADENLEASANWTRFGGVAGACGVRSNQLAILSGTQTAYAAPDTTKTSHWARALVGSIPGTPGGMPVAVRVVDANNWIGIRWSASQLQVWKCVAGTLSQIGTVNTAVSVGDQVMLVAEGTTVTVYFKGAVTSINGLAYAASALDSSTRVGVIARGSVMNPANDDFEVGRAA